MDPDVVSRDNVSNKQIRDGHRGHHRGHHRGNFRGNFRGGYRGSNRGSYGALGRSRQPNEENRYNDATNPSNDHLASTHNLQEQKTMVPPSGLQRGNTSSRGRVGRGIDRGQTRGRGLAHGWDQAYGRGQVNSKDHINDRSQVNDISREYGHTDPDMYSRATSPASSQAQSRHSISSVLWFQDYAHSPTGDLITRHSPVFQPDMNPDLAQLAIEYHERMNMNMDNNPWPQQQALRLGNLPYRDLPAAPLHSNSTSNVQPFYGPGKWEPANQPLHLFMPQISASANTSFQTGQTFQSSPLSYIGVFSTPQPFALNLSVAVSNTLNSPFGSMYMSILNGLLIPVQNLEEHGYKVRDFTGQELEDKQRCFRCGKVWSKLVRQNHEYQKLMIKKAKTPKMQSVSNNEARENSFQSKNDVLSPGTLASNSEKVEPQNPEPILRCRFHPGTFTKAYEPVPNSQGLRSGQTLKGRKFWTCCKKHYSAEPCSGSEHHELRNVDTKTLSAQWQTYATPGFIRGPMDVSHRIAVALDCEMGINKAGDSELIRVTVIDYFTTETLIDKLVFPTVPMHHLSSAYSGVTWAMLNAAAAKGECIHGRAAALEEVWKFVGPETIVVAHSGYNDLASLRWRHYRIVDTYLIDAIPEREKERERIRELNKLIGEQKAVDSKKPDQAGKETTKTTEPPFQGQSDKVTSEKTDSAKTQGQQYTPRKVKSRGPFSLQTLAKTRLDRDIQTGSKGHDSLEDALATRDLAHWHVRRIIEGRSVVNADDAGKGNGQRSI